jgi:Ca2+-binding RTX toxin-like protein
MRKLFLVGVVAIFALAATTAFAANIRGTHGNDTLTGTPNADRISGHGGNDTIDGLAGDDVLRGGTGNDTINGGDGNDKLKGNKGADTLNGGAGDDRIDGRGDGRTADTITCGDGNDVVKADRNDKVASDCETVKVSGGKGKHHAKGHSKDDTDKSHGSHNPGDDGKPGLGPKDGKGSRS